MIKSNEAADVLKQQPKFTERLRVTLDARLLSVCQKREDPGVTLLQLHRDLPEATCWSEIYLIVCSRQRG